LAAFGEFADEQTEAVAMNRRTAVVEQDYDIT
jgi:hypothetical protein